MDSKELADVKRELMLELRKDLKEMFFNEMMKQEASTPRHRAASLSAPDDAQGLECSLETLAKLLETNVVKVRNDLRLLTRKLDAIEAAASPLSPSPPAAAPQTAQLPSLPPMGHRSIPPPLTLESCTVSPDRLASSAKLVTLPLRKDSGKGASTTASRHKLTDAVEVSVTLANGDLFDAPGDRLADRRVYSARERKRSTAGLLEMSDSTLELSDEDSGDEDSSIGGTTIGSDISQSSTSAGVAGEEEIVAVNVGGRMFQTYARTIMRHPDSRLARYICSAHYQMENSPLRHRDVFFDRNSTAFEAVLDFYRTGLLVKPPELHEDIWKYEVAYWNVTEEDPKDKKKKARGTVKRKKKKKAGSHIKDPRKPDGSMEPLLRLSMPGRSWEDADVLRGPDEKARSRLFSSSDKTRAKELISRDKLRDKKDERSGSLLIAVSSIQAPELSLFTKKKDKVRSETDVSHDTWKKKRRSQSVNPIDLKKEKEKAEKFDKKASQGSTVKRSASNRSLS